MKTARQTGKLHLSQITPGIVMVLRGPLDIEKKETGDTGLKYFEKRNIQARMVSEPGCI